MLPAEAEGETAQAAAQIPARIYILADVIVLGIGGLLISLFTGYYFLGFSLKAQGWPGLIVFMVASFIGSAAHRPMG